MPVTWKDTPDTSSDEDEEDEDVEEFGSFAGDRRYQQTLVSKKWNGIEVKCIISRAVAWGTFFVECVCF